MGGGRHVLELLAGEDVDTYQVDLGVSVLASLAGGHFHNTAGTTLDDDVATFTQSGALHGEGQGGTGGGLLKDVLVVAFHLKVK